MSEKTTYPPTTKREFGLFLMAIGLCCWGVGMGWAVKDSPALQIYSDYVLALGGLSFYTGVIVALSGAKDEHERFKKEEAEKEARITREREERILRKKEAEKTLMQ